MNLKSKNEEIGKESYVKLDYLFNDKDINALFKEYDKKLRTIILGPIPDRIVKFAFYIILHHETLIENFIKYVKDKVYSENNLYFSIWQKCSDLRLTYKKIKDNL